MPTFVMALPGVCHGYGEKSVRVGGSVSNPSWLWEESVTCGDWLMLLLAIFHPVGLLSEP